MPRNWIKFESAESTALNVYLLNCAQSIQVIAFLHRLSDNNCLFPYCLSVAFIDVKNKILGNRRKKVIVCRLKLWN